MPRNEFTATEGLLHDVMRKQAGSLEKAVLEGVMNSIDAGADTIEVTVEPDKLTIEDDGKGMTVEEINTYFEQFGYKDEDIEEKDFGKFRMGRGQIYNFGQNIWHTGDNLLVVDLENDESSFHRDLISNDAEIEDVDVGGDLATVDTEGLSYFLTEASSTVEGCRIEVNLYNLVDDLEKKVKEVKKLVRYIPWMHNVELTVNGSTIWNEPDVYAETDSAYFCIEHEGFSTSTDIYNQGAFVKSEVLTRCSGAIISKRDLDVNFARNDILETDESWGNIVESYKLQTVKYLTEHDDISSRQRRWALEQAVGDDAVLGVIADVPLVESIKGEFYSINELASSKISFSNSDDKLAHDAMEDGNVLFLDDTYKSVVQDLVDNSNVLSYGDVVEQEMNFEMTEYNYSDLNKRRRQNFDRAEWVLDQVRFSGEFKPGYSQHKNVWKDDEDTLYVDKRYLKCSKQEFVVERIPHIIEVAAAPGDTRQGMDHNHQFQRQWWRFTEELGSLQTDLLDNRAP